MNNSHNLFIIPSLAIFISFLLIGYDIEKAFADVEITVITPTGGALTAASDCSGIGAQNHVIWMDCNDILYAISEDTNAVLANITVGATGAVIFSTISGTSALWVDVVANTITKYTYNSATDQITATGILTPPSCDLLGRDSFQYDVLGFVWTVCNSEDKVIKFNPNTMTQSQVSQDLTDAAGLECGSPTRVAFAPPLTSTGIGVIKCDLPTERIVTFSVATSTTITLLDDEIQANIADESLMIDANNFRIFALDSTDFEIFPYTSLGIISTGQIISGNNFAQCVNEPLTSNGASDFATFQVCIATLGATVSITGFRSNSTGTFQILNTIASSSATSDITLRTSDSVAPISVLVPIFYINSNSNNEKYVKITGIREVSEEPTSPSGGSGGNIIGGVDCSLSENEQKLLCRIGGDGSIGSAGAFVVGDGSEGTGLSGIGCSIGFVDCSVNDDVKTNGIGYLIFIAGVGVMMGFFFLISRGNLLAIPTFIWIISILSLAGAMALFNIIDPVIFIITIVAVIALAVPKILSTVRGDTTLGAGNTN